MIFWDNNKNSLHYKNNSIALHNYSTSSMKIYLDLFLFILVQNIDKFKKSRLLTLIEEIGKFFLQKATICCHKIDRSYYFNALETSQRNRNGEVLILEQLLNHGEEQQGSVPFSQLSVVFLSGLKSCENQQPFYLECWVIPTPVCIISGSDFLKASKQVRANCLVLLAWDCGYDWAKHVTGWSCACVQLTLE